MSGSNIGAILFPIFILQLAILPFTGLSWIMGKDGGVMTKVAGWFVLILGVILWAGAMRSC